MTVKSFSYKETIAWGLRFAGILEESDVVILQGDLGGGKTTFIKGIMQGLGYRRRVLSPTFTLVREYKTSVFLVHHIDLYRLQINDIFTLGIDDLLYGPAGGVTLIEWGDKIEKELPRYIKIDFSFLTEFARKLTFSQEGFDSKKTKAIRRIFHNEPR